MGCQRCTGCRQSYQAQHGRAWYARVVGIVSAWQSGTLLGHDALYAVVLTGLGTLAFRVWAGRRAFRVVGAMLLMGYSSLLIHLGGGLIELHFHVFVVMTFLLIYYDWLPI